MSSKKKPAAPAADAAPLALKPAIELAIDEAIEHLRTTAQGLTVIMRDEVLALADVAKATAAEVLAGTLPADRAKRNLERLANALRSQLVARAFAEKAAQVEWFRAWALRLLDIAAAAAL